MVPEKIVLISKIILFRFISNNFTKIFLLTVIISHEEMVVNSFYDKKDPFLHFHTETGLYIA